MAVLLAIGTRNVQGSGTLSRASVVSAPLVYLIVATAAVPTTRYEIIGPIAVVVAAEGAGPSAAFDASTAPPATIAAGRQPDFPSCFPDVARTRSIDPHEREGSRI